jgi:hypothetical protein
VLQKGFNALSKEFTAMIIGPRRIILIGAIAAIALTIIMVPLIFSLTAPDFTLVEVRLTAVTVVQADEENMQLRPVITIFNPTDQALTTSRIDYELFADGRSLGNHTISFEDIPLNGRPAIFAGGSVAIPPLTGNLHVVEFHDNIADVYDRIRDDPETIRWSARGEAIIESTLVQEIISFESRL